MDYNILFIRRFAGFKVAKSLPTTKEERSSKSRHLFVRVDIVYDGDWSSFNVLTFNSILSKYQY